uniref:Uncharacterized protein n=1 Tax=Arundo donax TaxID=35708 RepID=A0A0A9AEE5_ARUDO
MGRRHCLLVKRCTATALQTAIQVMLWMHSNRFKMMSLLIFMIRRMMICSDQHTTWNMCEPTWNLVTRIKPSSLQKSC